MQLSNRCVWQFILHYCIGPIQRLLQNMYSTTNDHLNTLFTTYFLFRKLQLTVDYAQGNIKKKVFGNPPNLCRKVLCLWCQIQFINYYVQSILLWGALINHVDRILDFRTPQPPPLVRGLELQVNFSPI